MALTVSEMLIAAHKLVENVDYEDAMEMIEKENALLLDVRDAPEIEQTGIAKGAHHIPRGMLEFRADVGQDFHDPEMDRTRPVILYCASGGRSALAGKVLLEMGYEVVLNLGSITDWEEEGGAIMPLVDLGMTRVTR